jgi:hypothetical protein
MNPREFITCCDTSCPLNDGKRCFGKTINISEDGTCNVRDSGPFEDKAEIEPYVEIAECQCQKCNHWEIDGSTDKGTCGLREPLTFILKRDLTTGEYGKPLCNAFSKQINQPGFTRS